MTGTRSAALGGALLLAVAAAAAAPPRRVVTLAPGLTETVASLGAGDRLVGVSDYVLWPESARALPRVGGLLDPNLERILALAPDLVLMPSPLPDVERAVSDAGARVVTVPMENLADVRAGILEVASLLGTPRRGRRLVAELDAQLDALVPAPGAARPRVLLAVDRPATDLRSITVAGPDTFLDELLARVGGRNVFSDAARRYFTPSLEEVLRRRPDLIVELVGGTSDAAAAEVSSAAQWARLFPPGAAPPVRVISDPAATIPGPRVATVARLLAAALGAVEPAR